MPRLFVEGEIGQYAQAVIAGTPVLTQCDVKNRWPDGSLKFAIVSFILPSLPGSGSVQVAFQNQSTGNNRGYLDQTGMLNSAYNFDAQIALSGAVRPAPISARAMLTAGKFSYWLQGPIVTAVRVADETTRAYDVKVDGLSGNPLHPMFEAWFYPQNQSVQLGQAMENAWISNSQANSTRDQSYAFTLCTGSTNCASTAPSYWFSQPTFTHIAFTRWHKTSWIGAAPSYRIDFNTPYLVSTGAIPNYYTTLNVTAALKAYQAAWNSMPAAQKSLTGTDPSGPGSGMIGDYKKYMDTAGAETWIGPQTSWETLYVLTFDDTMRNEMLTDADLMGYWPFHFREADSYAGSGKYFDAPTNTVGTLGRVVSLNARPLVALHAPMDQYTNCGGTWTQDAPVLGAYTQGDWYGGNSFVADPTHAPDIGYFPYLFTGQFYYLEELQFQASEHIAYGTGCNGANSYWHQGALGIMAYGGEYRGTAWGIRTLAHAAFISPDGTPEKVYFSDKLKNNIAYLEAAVGIATPTYASSSAAFHWGRNTFKYSNASHPSPLGTPMIGSPGYETVGDVQNCASASANFQENFLIVGLAIARDVGFATDQVLKAFAHRPFNIALNPVVNHFLNGAPGGVPTVGYVNCFKSAATNDWIQTWSDYNNYYIPPLPKAYQDGGGEHDYGLIAMAAAAMLAPYTVDGYSGQQVYNFLQRNIPYAQMEFTKTTPKWAILPSGSSSPTPTPLAITISSLPSGSAGTTYTATFSATGNTSPYTWSLSSGSLPPELLLSTNGVLFGTTTTVGTSAFTVQVTDAASTSVVRHHAPNRWCGSYAVADCHVLSAVVRV